jgi:tyrosyl-tRNA synthetase
MDADDILSYFERTTDQFISKDEFLARLRSGKKLRIKYRLDVKNSALHIGQAVNLWLLRHLQDAGHTAVIVFSDFTTRAGQFGGQLEHIVDIPAEEVENHIADLTLQVKTILRDDPTLLEIRRNSEWYAEMSVREILNIFSLVTHAKLISRDRFQYSIEEGKEIHINEMVYPILIGYDSYMVQSDISLLGSDNLFNESMGRFMQEKHKKKPQTMIITSVLPGIDGHQKQSQRRHNDISLMHSPRDKFGRAMSIPDGLIEPYLRIYTEVSFEQIGEIMKKNPRDAKIELAMALVERYHGTSIAAQERDWFDNTISKGYTPEDLPTLILPTDDMETLDLVSLTRPGKSRSDSRRLIQQGGIELNGHKLTRPEQELFLKNNDTLQVGRRDWFRIRIEEPPAFQTERLAIRSVHLHDVEKITKNIPQADIAKFIVRFSNKKKSTETDIKDAFKRVIFQQEPKHEWLWLIAEKGAPDKILGVAHLRSDSWDKQQNIWLAPGLVNEQSVVSEAMLAMSEHVLFKMDPRGAAFKKAFGMVRAPKSADALYQSMREMNGALLSKGDSSGLTGFTKEGWDQMQEWRRTTAPWLFTDDPRMAFNNKLGPKKVSPPEHKEETPHL